MASTSFSAVTALISGATNRLNFGQASDDTCIVYAPAGEAMDLSRLIVRVSNNESDIGSAGSGIRVFISASSSYSSASLGQYQVDVASNTSVVIGGEAFEAARFLHASADCVIFKVQSSSSATTAMCTFEAFMLPGGFTA